MSGQRGASREEFVRWAPQKTVLFDGFRRHGVGRSSRNRWRPILGIGVESECGYTSRVGGLVYEDLIHNRLPEMVEETVCIQGDRPAPESFGQEKSEFSEGAVHAEKVPQSKPLQTPVFAAPLQFTGHDVQRIGCHTG